MLALARRRLVQTASLRSRSLALRGYAVQQPSGLDEGELNIHNKLNDTFDPVELAVQDVSGESTAPLVTVYLLNRRTQVVAERSMQFLSRAKPFEDYPP